MRSVLGWRRPSGLLLASWSLSRPDSIPHIREFDPSRDHPRSLRPRASSETAFSRGSSLFPQSNRIARQPTNQGLLHQQPPRA
jgi:hypothetical protein